MIRTYIFKKPNNDCKNDYEMVGFATQNYNSSDPDEIVIEMDDQEIDKMFPELNGNWIEKMNCFYLEFKDEVNQKNNNKESCKHLSKDDVIIKFDILRQPKEDDTEILD